MENDQMRLRSVQSFSDTLSLVFDLVREGFVPTLKATLRLCGPWLVITSVLTAVGIGWLLRTVLNIESGTLGSEWNPFYDSNLVESIVLGVGLLFLIMVFYGIASTVQMAVTYVNVAHYNNNGIFAPFEEIRMNVKKFFWRLLFASIVSTIMVNVGMQFFYLPGVFVSVPLSMLMASMVAENLTLGQAMSKIFGLIKNRWWFTFGIILLTGLAQAAIVSIVMVPMIFAGIAVYSLGYSNQAGTVIPVLGAIAAVLMIVVSTLSNYVSQTAHMVLFYGNAEVTEGIGLEARIRQTFAAADGGTSGNDA